LALMSSHYPFHVKTVLAVAAIAAAGLMPGLARAQLAQQAAVSAGAKAEAPKSEPGKTEAAKTEAAKPAETPTTGVATATANATPTQKSIAERAAGKVIQAAKSASDVFARVPCLPPKGGYKSMGSLPHVANKLIAGQPVTIIAFGSSSTQGYGSSAPE